ncbi:glycosyltransferase family 2 protein [uncultured Fibrella sp.]|uniref:glycosyltransferase family 2 protein n=1 Tax=uncultured Fibrella sp. TaxID=1284596 RepID=UPI0035CA4171
MISILILTKNEEQDLPACLHSVAWCNDVHVYDSFSSDNTLGIAKAMGATITQRKFDNWSTHQNWGLANISFKNRWVLYIDADERVSPELKETLLNFTPADGNIAAYEIQRRDFAWNGTWLKHAQMSPYYLRLFRPDKMRYERLVNPISIPDGNVLRLNGYLDHYPFSKGFRYWWQRHLGYADLEAAMRMQDIDKGTEFSIAKAIFSKDFSERRYNQKGIFYKMPGRPLVKWFYLAIWRKGFLDGQAGLTYALLQAVYEYFIVLKTRELVASQLPNQKISPEKTPIIATQKF